MTDAAGKHPEVRASRTLAQSLIAKGWIAVFVLLGHALLPFVVPRVLKFRGSAGGTGNGAMTMGHVVVRYSQPDPPQLYLEFARLAPRGKTEVIARLPLRHGAVYEARASDDSQLTRRYGYRISFDLRHLVSRDPPVFERVGRFLVGELPVRRLWRPEHYCLRVVSPQPIQCTPPYYLASDLNVLDRDFVVVAQ